MRLPRLSSFTVIGVLLIFIGIYGILHGPNFQYDLGVQAAGNEGFYYLIVGALMILNGFFSLPMTAEEKKEQELTLSRQGLADKH